MTARPAPTIIACLLLLLAILLGTALVICPPRLVVFPLRMSQITGEGAIPHYIGLGLEFEPSQVQAAKVRMARKVKQAHSVLALAEDEKQQAEAVLSDRAAADYEVSGDATAFGAVDHEVAGWLKGVNEADEAIRKAELAVGALGEGATLADLKRAGRASNHCLLVASEAEAEMRRLRDSWQQEAARSSGGV